MGRAFRSRMQHSLVSRSVSVVCTHAFLGGLSLALAGPLMAQDAEPPSYRPLIAGALSESREAHWEEARALFRRANELYPNARALRGLGMASFELRDYAESVRALRASLAHAVQPLTAEQQTQVEGLLAQALLFVGSYTLVAPDDVVVTIDDRAVVREPDGTILLGLGAHRVRVRSREGRSADSAFDVQGGESGPLPIDLTAIAPVVAEPAVVVTPRLETEVVPPASEDVPRGADNTAPVALLVTGGLVAAAGGVCLALGVVDANAVTSSMRGTEWTDVASAYERAPILEGVGAAALGIGVVMAGVGGVLLATSSSEPVQVQVHAQGLSVRGVW